MRRWPAAMVLVGLLGGGVAAAQVRCMHDQRFYDAGATTCRNGQQVRCVDGGWEPTGEECAASDVAPPAEDDQPAVEQPPVGAD